MKLLEKHFDLAFTAPNGVQKLRELILTFAMQGKLVPQDQTDQPASELLKAIEAEKQRLVKEGKIKQPKPLPEIKPEEIPYELPDGWEWVRLHNYGIWKSGSTPSRTNSSYYDGGIPWVKSGEVKQGRIVKTDETITQEALESCSLSLNSVGSVLVAMYGANIGDVGVLEIEATTNQAVCACMLYSEIDNIFLSYLLISLKQNFISQSAGAAQPNISREKIIHTVVPLPPLAEQRRIVAKIDRLMAQCDELENLGSDRNQKRITVHTAAIDRLLTAQENSDFSTAWDFITQHFGELYSVRENVAELRKAILQLAVRGKLVRQDPNDQPAEVLLKQNQKLITEAKGIQKTIPELRTTEAKIPFGWARCQLADAALVVMGNSPPGNTYNDDGEGIPLINGPVEFSRGAFGLTLKTKYTTAPSRLCQKGDLLVCVRGATTGRTNIAAFDACVGRGVALVRGWEAQQYLNYLLWHLGQQLLEQGKGTTFPSIAYADLAGLEIWLPPLAEQQRIVAKIDQLMTLCDRLEQQIDAATSKRTELLNALMAQV